MLKPANIFIIVTIISNFLLAGTCLAENRVLVVHSYHLNYEWTHTINKAIVKELVTSGIDYQTFFMDTKRLPSKEAKLQAGLKAKKRITAYKPQVVIAVDDNAQAYVVKDFVNKSDIQFVFCGVNSKPDKYGYPAINVTGILERLYPDQTLRMLKAVLPKTKQVAVVTDDSPTSDSILPRFKKKARHGELVIPIREYAQPATVSMWKQTIGRLDRDPAIDAIMVPLYHTVKIDGTDKSMAPARVMRWTVDNTKKPVVGVWSHSVEDGAFFAVTVDPREHGRVAARMAIEILNNKTARDVPMQTNQEGFVIVNLKGTELFRLEANFDIEQIADRVIE